MNDDQLKKLLIDNNKTLLEQLDVTLTERLEINNAVLFGQMSSHFDERLDKQDVHIDERLDRLQTTVDGITKRLDTDDQERAATEAQLDRHEKWFGQLADATHTKLVPEP